MQAADGSVDLGQGAPRAPSDAASTGGASSTRSSSLGSAFEARGAALFQEAAAEGASGGGGGWGAARAIEHLGSTVASGHSSLDSSYASAGTSVSCAAHAPAQQAKPPRRSAHAAAARVEALGLPAAARPPFARVAWVEDCVKAGRALPLDAYLL
jgi:hypothetical protein